MFAHHNSRVEEKKKINAGGNFKVCTFWSAWVLFPIIFLIQKEKRKLFAKRKSKLVFNIMRYLNVSILIHIYICYEYWKKKLTISLLFSLEITGDSLKSITISKIQTQIVLGCWILWHKLSKLDNDWWWKDLRESSRCWFIQMCMPCGLKHFLTCRM